MVAESILCLLIFILRAYNAIKTDMGVSCDVVNAAMMHMARKHRDRSLGDVS